MCVDIGYVSSLGPDGLPHLIPGIKINRSLVKDDHDQPHIQAHNRPRCVVVCQDEQNTPAVKKLQWGLVADFMLGNPSQMKKFYNQLFNARSERLLQEGSLWFGLRTHRCLLVADGVYEHQEVAGRKQKLPYYVRPLSGGPFLIPGIYNPTTDSFAIITRAGNELFRTIHNSGANKHRMPLFLTNTMANEWIEHGLTDQGLERLISFEYPSGDLRAHTVFSIRSTLPRPDGRGVNEYYNWDHKKPMDQGSLF